MVNTHHHTPVPGGQRRHPFPRPAAAYRRRAQPGRAEVLRHYRRWHRARPGAAGHVTPAQSPHTGYRHAPTVAGTRETGHRQ